MHHAIYRLSLDMQKDSSGVTLHMKRRDTARQIHITLTDGGIPYPIPQSCYALLTARSPEGLLQPIECSIGEDSILCPVGAALTAAAGEVVCELRLYDRTDGTDALLLTSPRFTLSVVQPVQDGTEEEELLTPAQNALDSLIGRSQEAADAAQAVAERLQEAYESGSFDGKDGKDGKDGRDGIDGRTPVKGIDYYTPAEEAALLATLRQQQEALLDAFALWQEVRGEGAVSFADGADYPFRALKLYGRGAGSANLGIYIPGLHTAAVILRDPPDITAPAGAEVHFSVVTGGPIAKHQWEYSTNGGISWYSSSSSFPGYNTERMTVAVTEARNNFLYRCRIIGENGQTLHSRPGKLTVGEQEAYTNISWNTAAATLRLTLPAPLAGTEAAEGNCTDTQGQSWRSAVLDLRQGSFTLWGGAPVALEADLSGLRSHRGAFSLYCDTDAHIALTYLTDTKAYIDKKLEERLHENSETAG